MSYWLYLLLGSLLAGMGIVWSMVLPRRGAMIALVAGGVGAALAGSAAIAIGRYYQTPQAFAATLFFLVAAAATGYAISAATLPSLARRRRVRVRPPRSLASTEAVVLLACIGPERYDPRAVATQGADLALSGAIDIPLTATPFVYLAERTRYRAEGGTSPGATLTAALREATQGTLAAHGCTVDVRLAWAYSRPTLAEAVAELNADGARAISVVVLGTEDSDPVDRARREADAWCASDPAPAIAFGPPLWFDSALPARLVTRIIETVGQCDRADIGVVLACAGQAVAPGGSRSAASAEEAYFNQRVRMLLAEEGFVERQIRVGWLEWQLPDVTESVRHLAALGCTRLVVCPSTIVLPSISTGAELRHAVELARLPSGVEATIMPTWEIDAVLVGAVARIAEEALDTLRQPCGL